MTGRAPRLCFVATALGDNPTVLHWLIDAAQSRGFSASHPTLFPMPNVDDITAHLLDHDVVLYRGTDFAEAVSEHAGAAAYFVDAAEEIRLDTRML